MHFGRGIYTTIPNLQNKRQCSLLFTNTHVYNLYNLCFDIICILVHMFPLSTRLSLFALFKVFQLTLIRRIQMMKQPELIILTQSDHTQMFSNFYMALCFPERNKSPINIKKKSCPSFKVCS